MLKILLKVTIIVLIANSLAFALADFVKSADLVHEKNPDFSMELPSLSPSEPMLRPL